MTQKEAREWLAVGGLPVAEFPESLRTVIALGVADAK